MSASFGLIYFIHDDTKEYFRVNIIPSILKADFHENIKVVLIRNIREVGKDMEGKPFVTYRSEVSEVNKNEDGKLFFKKLTEDGTTWENAFLFTFKYLREKGFFQRLGLITLSHSNGFVINRNGEKLPILIFNKVSRFIKKLFGRSISHDLKYIRSTTEDGSLYFNSQTVLGPRSNKDNRFSDVPTFESKYSRTPDSSFCKTYEGLFVSTFSKFLTDSLGITDQESEENLSKKMVFFISSNCNFQLYDNVFQFRRVAAFVMGAQSRNSSSFWDFPKIVEAIAENIVAPNLEISKRIFLACKQKFSQDRTEKIKHYFLSNTEEFDTLHKSFNGIISTVIENLHHDTGYRLQLLRWVNEAKVTSNEKKIPYYDILQFFNHANDIASIKFNAELDNFKQLTSSKIILDAFSKDPVLSGFSLYLPRNEKEFSELKGPFCNYFNPEQFNAFSLNSSYDDFLTIFFQ